MSKRNYGEKIKLQTYDSMFGEDGNTEAVVSEQIKDVALSELHTFQNHPFKVLDDEKMEEMVESVKQYGILVPAIAREREEGGYELISGHRRHHAATLAGLERCSILSSIAFATTASLKMLSQLLKLMLVVNIVLFFS